MSAQESGSIEATVHKIVADRFINPVRVTDTPSLWPITAGANA
jgi:hypothetical protein